MADAAQTPVILAAKRTPIGKFFGGLSKVPSPELGAYAIQGMLESAPALKDAAGGGRVDEVIMGCVLQAGLGQNPARQAALKAGLPETTSAVTINKVCGSGLQAVMQAAQSIKAGDNQLVIAGGFENMTAAPHFARVREGVKFGPTQFEDHMQYDGLRCAFECWGMTNGADHIAKRYEISRAEQDRFSAQSHQRAAEATKNGWFKDEIVALSAEQIKDKRYNAGAGVADHLHGHIVPRWRGDTNFMPVLDDVRIMPEYLDDAWRRLHTAFADLPGERAAFDGEGAQG